jgi:hypothetical protein
VNPADERVGSARPCVFNPIRRAIFQQVLLDARRPNPIRRALFQQVLLDARRPAVAHPAASVLSDLIVSVSI